MFMIIFLISFIVLEIFTRIWIGFFLDPSKRFLSHDELKNVENLGLGAVYEPHYYTLYNLKRNYKNNSGTIHNDLGLRDHRTFEKKDDEIRVVFIGGSTTYTIGIKDNRTIFSADLEKKLNEHYCGKKIQVVNAGMGGATSAENLLRLIFFVSEIEPDIVVIQHGLNDVWTRATESKIKSDFSNYRSFWGKSLDENKNININREKPILSAVTTHLFEKSKFTSYLLKYLGYNLPSYKYNSFENDSKTDRLSVGTLVNRSDVVENVKFLKDNTIKYFERNTKYMIAICKEMGATVVLTSEPYTAKAGIIRNVAMVRHNKLLKEIANKEKPKSFDSDLNSRKMV